MVSYRSWVNTTPIIFFFFYVFVLHDILYVYILQLFYLFIVWTKEYITLCDHYRFVGRRWHLHFVPPPTHTPFKYSLNLTMSFFFFFYITFVHCTLIFLKRSIFTFLTIFADIISGAFVLRLNSRLFFNSI